MCPYCGSSDVILKTNVSGVKFRFNKKGIFRLGEQVILLTDVADKIYWDVVYNGVPAKCKCQKCGKRFSYKKWETLLANAAKENNQSKD